jgi:hypothetical protein
MLRLSNRRWRVLLCIHNEDLADYQGSSLAMLLCRHNEELSFYSGLIGILAMLC